MLAATLSVVIPGAGQLFAGRSRRAIGYLIFSALLVAIVVAGMVAGVRRVMSLVVQPSWLMAGLVLILISAAVRIVAAVDAYRLVRPANPQPRASAAVGIVAVSVIAVASLVPHEIAARLVWAQHNLVTSVFPSTLPTPVRPDSPGEAAGGVLTTAAPEPDAGPNPSASGTGAPGGPSLTVTHDLWGTDGRYTVLLLGSDAGPGRVSARTDTMMLLTISKKDRSAVLIGIPRNLEHIPFVKGLMQERFPDGFDDLANAVYRYGLDHPSLFPGAHDPGASALEQAIVAATGLEIDNWAMVNLAGVVGVADALGGLTLDVPKAVSDVLSPYEPGMPSISASIPAGTQHLTPDELYIYVRTRHADNDYERMGRQRCVMAAIGKELTGPRLLTAYPQIADAIIHNVSTDIPQAWLPDLVSLGSELNLARVRTLLLVPPRVDTTNPDYPKIREFVHDAIEVGPSSPLGGAETAAVAHVTAQTTPPGGDDQPVGDGHPGGDDQPVGNTRSVSEDAAPGSTSLTETSPLGHLGDSTGILSACG